ncbi:hypothetical protein QJT89_19545, partial [Bordetella bronchiseptica]
MPTDDKARPRKTLTIKKTAPAAPSADDEAPRRKRTGARARLVAQMERAKEQQHAPRRPPAGPPTASRWPTAWPHCPASPCFRAPATS